jgi:hypothetical protein
MTARCSFGRLEGESESEWDGEGGESMGSDGQAGRLAKDCAGDSVGAQSNTGVKKGNTREMQEITHDKSGTKTTPWDRRW